jgi:hypothetical protein
MFLNEEHFLTNNLISSLSQTNLGVASRKTPFSEPESFRPYPQIVGRGTNEMGV